MGHWVDNTVMRVSRRCAEFEAAGFNLSFPPLDVLDLACDKGRTLEVASKVGVPIPGTVSLPAFQKQERRPA